MPLGPWLLAPASAVLSLGVGFSYYQFVQRHDPGTPRMQEIAALIRSGAAAFLRREYKVLAVFVAAMALALFALATLLADTIGRYNLASWISR
jgi:K(+)-stimulated pyrophosphate-energized sodium pump